MTTEQEKQWREEFEKWNNYPLRDDVYQRIDIWLAACQSMQAQLNELLIEREGFRQLWVEHKEKCLKLEAELGKAHEFIKSIKLRTFDDKTQIRFIKDMKKWINDVCSKAFEFLKEQDKSSEG